MEVSNVITQKHNLYKDNGLWHRMYKNRYGYLFIFPVFLVMGIFKYYPAFTAFLMSFFDWNGYNKSSFIGLNNFIQMWSDKTFLASMRNVSLLSAANVLKVITLPLIAAELVYWMRSEKGKEIYKFIFVVPMVVPGMVVILMWKWIYNPTFGALNKALSLLGDSFNNHAWLGSADTALLSLIFVGFPWIGGIAFLVYLGGLQAISEEIYEAAKIDGASWLDRLLNIDLPLIGGQIRLLVITTIISSMDSFENVFVLTNGGPGDYTMVPALHLYQQGINFYKMGYACAIGVFMFLIILILTIISFKVKNNEEGTN